MTLENLLALYRYDDWANLRQMMEHVITHSAYHRGQVTARLMDLGKESVIVGTDLMIFYDFESPPAGL